MLRSFPLAQLLALSLAVAATPSIAKVTAEEAAKLKNELTPLGGMRAGNEEGTIPAWDGGMTTVPEGYESGDKRPEPFADEKPRFTIDADNVEQYADKLPAGQVALIKKYPEKYFMNVYPTHRTAAAPQWVYDNTFKNATSAEATEGGFTVEGAYGGLPFPIPKSGAEVFWNHTLRWQGVSKRWDAQSYITSSGGDDVVLGAEIHNHINVPYYFPDGNIDTLRSEREGNYFKVYQTTEAPATKAGFAVLLHDNLAANVGRQAWLYLVGQRRVRRSPTFNYDTPNPVTSGIDFVEEPFVHLGPFAKHTHKLVGKREVFIAYNTEKSFNVPAEELVGNGKFWNPEHVRYELHRVWVVESNLREGERHVVPTKTYYFDEDTGIAVYQDGYDASGELWRFSMAGLSVYPEFPMVNTENFATMDLLKGGMSTTVYNDTGNKAEKRERPYRESELTAEYMASEALR